MLIHEHKLIQQEKNEQALKASTENHSTPNKRGICKGSGRGNNDSGNQQKHQHQDNQFQGREKR